MLSWSVALLTLVAGSSMVSATPVSSTSGLTAHGHGLAPLGARDQRLYREIMALQDEARWDAADVLIGRLRDPLLLGHVQRQRYMHPDAYRSTYAGAARLARALWRPSGRRSRSTAWR